MTIERILALVFLASVAVIAAALWLLADVWSV